MQSYFDFVCLGCRRTNKYSLELLSPEHSFQCPYCKSTFSVVDSKIKMIEAGKALRSPLFVRPDLYANYDLWGNVAS